MPAATAAPAQTALGPLHLANARSLNVVAGPGATVYVLAGSGHDWHLYRSEDGAASFGPPVLVTGGTQAEVLADVRPALAVGPDGALAAAWVESAGGGTSQVRAAFSVDDGQSFGQADSLAQTTDPETTMAAVTFDAAGAPWVTWLQNSTVRLAVGEAAGHGFGEPVVVDDLVCECCQPAPLVLGDRVLVAYRNLVRDAAGVASRDIHVAASTDGGATFGEPVRVSDGSWHIDACPIAGPALAAHGSTLYAVWMDGRFDDGTFSRTDVWLAASADDGATFGPNVRINDVEGFYNGQPSLAIDPEGGLHVVWVGETAEGEALLYAASTDGGRTFSPARTLVTGEGRLGNAVVAVGSAGRAYVGWTDAAGGHVQPLD